MLNFTPADLPLDSNFSLGDFETVQDSEVQKLSTTSKISYGVQSSSWVPSDIFEDSSFEDIRDAISYRSVKNSSKREKKSKNKKQDSPRRACAQMALFDTRVIHSLDDEVLDKMDDFIHLFNGIVGGSNVASVSKIVEAATEVIEEASLHDSDSETIIGKIKDYVFGDSIPKNITKHVFGASTVVIFVSSSLHAIYTRDKKSLGLALASALGIFIYTDVFKKFDVFKLLGFIFKRRNDDVKSQFDNGDMEDLMTSIATLLTCAHVKGAKSGDFVKEAMRGLSSFQNIKKTLSDIFTFVIKIVERIVNYVRMTVVKTHPARLILSKNTLVNEFLEKFDILSARVDSKEFNYTPNNFAELLELINEGNKLVRCVPRDTDYNTLCAHVGQALSKLQSLKKLIVASSPGFDGIRQEPTSIMLIGGPGNAKSIVMDFITYCVTVRTLTGDALRRFKEKPTDYIFVRQNESVYWSGFTCLHHCVQFDDYGQSRPVLGKDDNEYMDWIRLVNAFPMLNHMDKLEEKGVVYANPKFVIASTNLERFDCEPIQSIDAFCRRVHFGYKVIPKKEFMDKTTEWKCSMDRRIDFSKLPLGEFGQPDIDPENILEFLEVKFVNGHSIETGKRFTFDQVVDRAVEFSNIQKNRFEQHKSNVAKAMHRHEPIDFDDPIIMEDIAVAQGLGIDVPVPITTDEVDVELVYDVNPDLNLIYNQFKDLSQNPHDPAYDEIWDKIIFLARHMTIATGEIHHPNFLILVQFCNHFGMKFLSDTSILEFPEYSQKYSKLIDERWQLIILTPAVISTKTKFRKYYEDCKSSFSKLFSDFKILLDQSFCFCVDSLTYLFKHHPIISYTISGALFGGVFGAFIEWIGSLFGWDLSPLSFREQKMSRELDFALTENEETRFEIVKTLGVSHMVENVLKHKYANERQIWDLLFDQMTPTEVMDKVFFENHAFDEEPQSIGQSGKGRGSKTKRSIKSMRAKHNAQMGLPADKNGHEIMLSIIDRNSWFFDVEKGLGSDEFRTFGSIVFVLGSVAIVPKHYYMRLFNVVEDEPRYGDLKVRLRKFKIDKVPNPRTVLFTVKEILQNGFGDSLEHNDLCLINFPEKMQPCKNILSFFPTRKEFDSLSVHNVRAYIVREKCLFNPASRARVIESPQEITCSDGEYSVAHVVKYEAFTEDGDCGSLITFISPHIAKAKIFAIHIAGIVTHNVAIGALVFKEDLEECLVNFPKIAKIDDSIDYDHLSDFSISDGRFDSLGRVDKGVSQGSKTDIIRAQFRMDWHPVMTAPAILSPRMLHGVRTDPFDIAIKNYCTEDILFDKEWLRVCAADLYDCLEQNCTINVKRELFSFEMVVFGDPNDSTYAGLNRNSSAGYPHNVNPVPGYRCKEWFMGKGVDYDRNSEQLFDLKNSVYSLILSCSRGIYPETIFTDCLKDERRPIPKVHELKTRLFACVAIIYCVAFEMFFGAFKHWMTKNPLDSYSALAVNPYTEWHLVALELMRFSMANEKGFGAGDYAKFDGSKKTQPDWAVLFLINRWYDDGAENAFIRQVLWMGMIFSKHIYRDMIYQWFASLPSGHPFTTQANILTNAMNFRMCWLDLHEGDFGMMTAFRKNVGTVFLGDDNLFSVTPAYRALFNEAFLAESMLKIGMVYTNETKGEVNISLRTLTEVEFLKRKFRYCDIKCQYVAPLKLDTIFETCLWTRNRHDAHKITADNVQWAIDELTLHGKEVFDKYVPKLCKSLKEGVDMWPDRTDFFTCYDFVTKYKIDFY